MSCVLKKPDDVSFSYAVSSGGTVSVLAGAGGFSACQLAGITEFKGLFGVSGGAIITALRALGRTPNELLHMAVEEDFSKHVAIKGGVLGPLYSQGRRKRQLIDALKRLVRIKTSPVAERAAIMGDEENWSSTGLLGTSGLGKFIQSNAVATGLGNAWPPNYTTMATLKDGAQVVFNKDGVFKISLDDKMTHLTAETAPLSLAVRASSAIPGVITAIKFKDLLLFDGALSRDGLCPVGMQIRHFGADPETMLACRIGEDASHFIAGPAQRTIRRMWMVHPDYRWGPETAGVSECRPPIDHIHSLKFHLSDDEKWLAILISFESHLKMLTFRGLLYGDRLRQAQDIFKEIGYWRDITPANLGEEQVLAPRATKVFTAHGLF